MADVVTGSLQIDLKRRTTLPGDILAAAGIPAGSPLVARVEEPGRIVLESPALLLSRLQDDIAAALARTTSGTAREGDDDSSDGQLEGAEGPVRDLVSELLADRASDSSLTTRHDEQQDQQAQGEPASLGYDSTYDLSGAAAAGGPGAPYNDLLNARDGAA